MSKNKEKKRYAMYILLVQTLIFIISIMIGRFERVNADFALSTGFFIALVGPMIFLLISITKEKKDKE